MGKSVASSKHRSKCKQLVLQAKLDQGSCALCSERDVDLLEFSHWDRSTKYTKTKGKKVGIKYTSSLGQLSSTRLIREELPKGRFLCIFCHRKETREEDTKRHAQTLHTLDEKGSTLAVDSAETFRICKGRACKGKIRLASFFRANTHPKSNHSCKLCHYILKVGTYKKKHAFINDIKIEIGECAICSLRVVPEETILFDFDHLAFKNCNVSSLVFRSENHILNEIKLCQLLCCKCHRQKTNEDARA